MDADGINELLTDAAKRGINYLEGVAEQPVFPKKEDIARLSEALNLPFPDGPTGDLEVLRFADEFGTPATVASPGGRYFGFVTGGALPASVATSWLARAWDQNSFSQVSSPAADLFDKAAHRWLIEALNLPKGTATALVTGATMANFTCLAAARSEVLRRDGWDVESNGLFGALPIHVIVGEEVHSTIAKVLAMLGLGRSRVTRVPADRQGRMIASQLPEINGPTIVCIQAGNVNSGAFDPAEEIIQKAHAQGAWVHVDGAFGLWANASPKLQHLVSGFEKADSWATDCHKWLNVPYDCGAAFVRSPEALYRAMSISGSYLLLGDDRDAIDGTPQSSQRSRGVEVWAALKSLGRSGLRDLVEMNCEQARYAAKLLTNAGADILNDVVLNQVVVRLDGPEQSAKIVASIQESGECWCGSTVWQGHPALRISVSSWATTNTDIERSVRAIVSAMQLHDAL